MKVQFIGEPISVPGKKDSDGKPSSNRIGIATVFPKSGIIVTLPGVHTTQRMAYTDRIDQERRNQGLDPLDSDQRMEIWLGAVDLLMDDEHVFIRPDPDRMDLSFEADQLLQTIVPRQCIRFLFANNDKVRSAINLRGEAWRIQPLPRSMDDMCQMINRSRVAVQGKPIYYYCGVRGTRILTYQQFVQLGEMRVEELRQHLQEIATLGNRRNAMGWEELQLFMAGHGLQVADLLPESLAEYGGVQLREMHRRACERFAECVPVAFKQDDVKLAEWRNRMYCTLIAQGDDTLSDEDLLGLSNEYFMQIRWLPGARIEGKELIFDTVTNTGELSNSIVHELICNVIREHDKIKFINIGQVERSVSNRVDQKDNGRREVYIMHFRTRDSTRDELQIIRFHKWGVRERLEEGKDLTQAMLESEEYTDFILDRRLACRQLGMNLVSSLITRKIQEIYYGKQGHLNGMRIWTPYVQRDYISGVATDKVPPAKLRDSEFVRSLAQMLGQAAASNLIVGRATPDHKVVFDDGDEILLSNPAGQVTDMVIADPTGAFMNFEHPLTKDAPAYAAPINRRKDRLGNREVFTEIYLQAFVARFDQIQNAYRRHRAAFDSLFSHRRRDPGGNLAHRWTMILKRLDSADPDKLCKIIRDHIKR